MIRFQVLGHAEPAGSKKSFRHARTGAIVTVDDNAKSRPWKQQVAGAAHNALVLRDAQLLTGPLEVSLTFVRARPKGHYGSGRNADKIKASAPQWPTTKPDVDKLSRGCLDALTGVLYRDDAQVVRKTVAKFYGAPERVEISVRELVG